MFSLVSSGISFFSDGFLFNVFFFESLCPSASSASSVGLLKFSLSSVGWRSSLGLLGSSSSLLSLLQLVRAFAIVVLLTSDAVSR